jgi:inner membrane transporter RhtA
LRVVAAAVVLLAVARPWHRHWSRHGLLAVAAFGVVTASMNLCFYEAIDRLPLGTAVAIEFAGPVTVAAVATRSPRQAIALALTIAGVGLLSGVELSVDAVGVVFALLAAALWAAYIVTGARVSREQRGVDGLAVGLAIGALALLPIGIRHSASVFASPRLLGLCLVVGVSSNAVPYAFDQVVLRRVTRRTFALLLALLPMTATVIGALVLRQIPSVAELIGIALVVAALCVRGALEHADAGHSPRKRARFSSDDAMPSA